MSYPTIATETAAPPPGIDPGVWEFALRLSAQLVAGARLVEDLEAAVDQYPSRVPVAHVRLILQRYRERLAGCGRDGRPLHRHEPTDYCAGLGCGCYDPAGVAR